MLSKVISIVAVAAWLLAGGVESITAEPMRSEITDRKTDVGSVDVRLAIATETAESHFRPRRRRRRARPYKVVEVSNGGVLTGTVLFKGQPPEPETIAIVKDHATCTKRPTTVPKIRLDAGGHVAEAVVFLGDITRGKAFTKRDKPPVIDQHFCTFVPHVQALRVKEPVEIINRDDVAHNINVTQRIYTLFNILQPIKDMKSVKTFDKPGIIQLRCNVHNWMHGYVYVFNHPYYQVTAADGAFRLDAIPPGEYEVVVWQEYLGEQSMKVTVKAGQATKLPIELSRDGDESSSK